MITKIFNINKIFTFDTHLNDVVSNEVDTIFIKNENILKIGNDSSIKYDKEINAHHTSISPGFIDSHTHLIFSSNRSNDFSKRISGSSYLDIANSGGGIKSSIKSLRETSKDDILKKCKKDITYIINNGTTTLEAKSGYGLDVENEIMSLEIIKELNKNNEIEIIPTFMGAHDFPHESKNKESYIDIICNEMIPEISNKRLAEFCDIFCEEGYFSHSQTLKISNIAKENGMSIKLHVDEFKDFNGAYLAGEISAVSADHLMKSNKNGLMNMARNNVVATILPGTTLFLGLNSYANAKKMIDCGCDVAIASDYNPGSCTLFSIPIIMALSCLYCGLSIKEAFKGVTFNAAKALRRESSIGLIKDGYQADILFWDISNINEIPYWFNSNRILKVMKRGKLIRENNIN